VSTSAASLTQQPKIGRPFKFQDVDALQAGIDAYFTQCEADKRPCTMSGLANSLGTNRQTLLAYEGERDGRQSPGEPFVRAIKQARSRVEQAMEERLLGKECHPVGAIFNLKNNFGWKDVQEVEHTHVMYAVAPREGELPLGFEPPCIDVTPLSQNQAQLCEVLSAGDNRVETFANQISPDVETGDR
jgi:hypothetical protein